MIIKKICLISIFSFLKIVLLIAQDQVIGNNSSLPTVAIVMTGGTIAEKTDPKTRASVPIESGKDLVQSIPALLKIANIKP